MGKLWPTPSSQGSAGEINPGVSPEREEVSEQRNRESAANKFGDGSEVRRTSTHLDLFSGIGGFALAAQWAGFRTIGFCEIDKYCQKVLAKNFGAISYPSFNGCGQGRTWRPDTNGEGQSEQPFLIGNIFDFDATLLRGVDLITGGFPCQPFSVAGKRRGAEDDRAIWPEMFRIISEARPTWVLGENVPGIIPMELDNVLSDLEGIGYATRSFVIPACAVDARHRRYRIWITARNISDTERERRRCGNTQREDAKDARQQSTSQVSIRHSTGTGLPNGPGISLGRTGELQSAPQRPNCDGECRWQPEPDVGRVAHGIPSRVDRLKGLGNAIVPQVAYEILRVIKMQIDDY